MRITLDDKIKSEILNEMRTDLLSSPRMVETEIHLSDVTRCITKTYWSRQQASEHKDNPELPGMQVDDKGVVFMYLGVLAEELLNRLRNAPSEVVNDDFGVPIVGNADWLLGEDYIELKTTRIYIVRDRKKPNYLMPSKGFPQEWIRRILGYCYMYGKRNWKLGLVQMISGDVHVYDFEFSDEEIQYFWETFVAPRTKALDMSLRINIPPKPFEYNEGWECRNCNFNMSCQFWSGEVTEVLYDKQFMDRHDTSHKALDIARLNDEYRAI